MRIFVATLMAGACLAASPALARGQQAEPEKPITDRSVSAADVVTTPMNDLNLRKDEIPTLLIAAQSRPYDTAGLKRCPQITTAVRELDAMLGDDLDLPQEDQNKMSAGRVAQAAVGSFIPFRGLIREISGANSQERKLNAAISAGNSRRAFLKGYGEAKGCAYPARSVTPAALQARYAAQAKAEEPKQVADKSKSKGDKVTYVEQPVVQKTD